MNKSRAVMRKLASLRVLARRGKDTERTMAGLCRMLDGSIKDSIVQVHSAQGTITVGNVGSWDGTRVYIWEGITLYLIDLTKVTRVDVWRKDEPLGS